MDYHILDCSEKENWANVVFHINVPNENNAVGVNLRTATSQYNVGETVSRVPWLETENPSEYAAIQAGEVWEIEKRIEYSGNATNAQKQATIDAKYTALAGNVPNLIRARLRFWGLDRNVS